MTTIGHLKFVHIIPGGSCSADRDRTAASFQDRDATDRIGDDAAILNVQRAIPCAANENKVAARQDSTFPIRALPVTVTVPPAVMFNVPVPELPIRNSPELVHLESLPLTVTVPWLPALLPT